MEGLAPRSVRRLVESAVRCAGDLVDGWQPVNEMNIYPILKFRGLGFPPGHDDRDEAAAVMENLHLGTAEAAVRLRDTEVPVASIFSLFPAIAQDETPATVERVERETQLMWDPGLGLFTDGVLRVRRPKAGTP